MSYSAKIFVCEKHFSYCFNTSLRNFLGIHKLQTSFFASHIQRKRGLCVNLSTQDEKESLPEINNTEKLSTKNRKLSKSRQRHSENVISYLKQHNSKLDEKSIPEKYISKSYNHIESLYVVGESTADTIAASVVQDDVNTPVLEVNPGLGVVTEALLKKRVCEVHAFQAVTWDVMNELVQKSDRLVLHKYDFFSIWKRVLLDYFDEKIILNKMRHVNPKPWNDGPPMKIFVPSPNKLFINHLIAALAFQKGFLRLGRLEMYLAMRPYDYHRVTCDGSAGYKFYHASSVLFQILFEKQFLCLLPRKDFIPWVKQLPSEKIKSPTKLINIDPDFMYLVKITPRKDLHEIVQGAENLKALWHFVRQCFSVRSNQVIPTLEKWIPGCGPRLIFNNLSIVTEFGELSPQEMLKLFQMFSQWPEYDHCPFLSSMDTYFLRSYIDHNPEGIHEEEFGNIDEEDLVTDTDLDGISDSVEKTEGI